MGLHLRELQLEAEEAYEAPWLDLGDLMEIVDLDRPDLKLPVWTPQPRGASTSSGRSAGTFTTLRSDAIARPANDDCPK